MNKDQMAHEFAIARLSSGAGFMTSEIVEDSWRYADLMQVEADKRRAQKQAEMRELLNDPNTFVEKEGMHFDDVNFEVDWSVAPEWANAWTYREPTNEGVWWTKPPTSKVANRFVCHLENECMPAPNFGYTGDWRDSLRMRPEGECRG